MKRVLLDIEGDGLLPELTKLHCIATVDVDTGERRLFGPGDCNCVFGAAIEYLSTADVLIAHFGLGYDFPAIQKVTGWVIPPSITLRDTVVLARLKYPNIKELDSKYNASQLAKRLPPMGEQFGKHTIEAWGIRLKCAKIHTDITDWSKWTPEIQERCVGDVETNLRLWQYLNMDAYSQPAIELEHRIQVVCNKMTAAGWPFDVKKAGKLHADLLEEKDRLEKALKSEFGGWWAPKGPAAIKGDPKTKGQFTPKRNDARMGYVAGQVCTKIEWIEFNPKSLAHVERCMRKLGWVPTAFTETGGAKLDEEVLDSIETEYPQAAGLTRYLMLCKRLGQLAEGNQAWLKKVAADGCIHGQYNPMGTVTSRAAHYDPNIGQVPSVSSPFGAECRELFVVPQGWELVGADMEGLEGRCQGHYQWPHDGGEFARLLLEGDWHWKNVLAMGLLPADTVRIKDQGHPEYQLHTMLREHGAKRWFYALIYGMGAVESGSILLNACRAVRKENPEWGFVYEQFYGKDEAPSEKVMKRVGGSLKKRFMDNSPALQALIRKVTEMAEDHGKLPGLDKRVLPIRAAFSSFNALLQSAGAILCKRWVCDAHDALLQQFEWGRDFVILGWIHDEVQVSCRKGLGKQIGDIIVKAAQQSGEPYGFRMRLDSSYKVGANWAQTH
jgi:DNA polymerase-1